jgi:hypothetical protein
LPISVPIYVQPLCFFLLLFSRQNSADPALFLVLSGMFVFPFLVWRGVEALPLREYTVFLFFWVSFCHSGSKRRRKEMFDAELRERKRLRAGGGSVYCGSNWDHTKSCNLCVDSIRPGPVRQHFSRTRQKLWA